MNKAIPNVDFVKFGQQVLKVRHRRRMTQWALGSQIGISDTIITNCEFGRPITKESYQKLCDFLGIHNTEQQPVADREFRQPDAKPASAVITNELDMLVAKLQLMMTGRQALAKVSPDFNESYSDEIKTLRKTIGVVAMLRASRRKKRELYQNA